MIGQLAAKPRTRKLQAEPVADVPVSDETLVTVIDEHTTVFQGAGELTFPNLPTAMAALVETIQADESNKLRMARIVDAIDRLELYREAGASTMKEFFPILLKQTAAVGWKSETSIKRYLAWYRLYISQLQLDPSPAMAAVSHLHELYTLAELDRKSGELAIEATRDGKLNGPEFEDITRLVIWLVHTPTLEQARSGIGAEELGELLDAQGFRQSCETYKKLMGRELHLPAGGWSLEDTRAIVGTVKGRDEADEDEDEGEDETAVVRVWTGELDTMNNLVCVKDIEFRRSGEVIDRIEVNKPYTRAVFKLLRDGDAAEIAGEEGAQGDGDAANE